MIGAMSMALFNMGRGVAFHDIPHPFLIPLYQSNCYIYIVMSEWTTDLLKQHFEQILLEKENKYNQRFESQEKAIQTAEHGRDVAINKAETSIEKKSDAVYVKLTDLQKALTEVMLRPEIEARFKGLSEKLEDLKTSSDTGAGKSEGYAKFIGWIAFGITLLLFLFFLYDRTSNG